MVSKSIAIEERLRDIVKWGESLARHIDRMTQSQFMADEKTQHAATKCIEAIGEAASLGSLWSQVTTTLQNPRPPL